MFTGVGEVGIIYQEDAMLLKSFPYSLELYNLPRWFNTDLSKYNTATGKHNSKAFLYL